MRHETLKTLLYRRSLLEGSMSNFTLRKTSPTGNDMKSTTQETTLRQQGFHEVNKRRTLLQDNSWIKKRPEEERDENYGRAVLHRHNSHDALDRKANERDEPKATISRYRSDDTLDRISDRSDAAKTHKANSLDNRLTNRNVSTFQSLEARKTQPGGLFSANATNTPASTSATTPVKKKRQSWFPPPPPGYSAAPSTGASSREPTVHPPILPKPSPPVPSPNQLRQDNRSQDLKNIVQVATSLQKTDKGEELDNLIKMNKSLKRNQGLDGLFRANLKAEPTEKRAKSLENLVFVNTRTDKDGKGKQDLNGLIKVNLETNTNIKRGQSLDDLIKVTPEVNRSNPGSKDLDNLIKVNPRTGKSVQGGQSLDSFIKVAPETNRAHQGKFFRNQDLDSLVKVMPSADKSGDHGLDKLINVSPKAVKDMAGNQGLDKLIQVNPETLTKNHRDQDLDNLIKVSPAVLRSNQRDQDQENLIEVNSSVLKNKNERLDGQVNGCAGALIIPSSKTTAYSPEAKRTLSSSAETRHAGPKDTVVYTRTYMEKSKSPKDRYQESISGKYIQTVYSTSDRSVIERDMCTYCRKPLGTETKMILDELQICCHSTCFKCEICKQSLENLQAGDSIWIYRQTIHCEPCYSKVVGAGNEEHWRAEPLKMPITEAVCQWQSEDWNPTC
ncbi:sciellin isoform X5 [Phacochoerus africanus]|uniref:sciellin isoform X5 n=1 Tax=Phacochoerus africanus TaxID=41426 RepID=UPI001FD8E6EC|nr:sciellin isoform X5 [Phacochoerus africanus]